MKIPKKIAEKVAKYRKLQNTADALFEEIQKFFDDLDDGVYYGNFSIEAEPKGVAQDEGEYCDQYTDYCGDSGGGTYYYPIDGSDKYVAVDYTF